MFLSLVPVFSFLAWGVVGVLFDVRFFLPCFYSTFLLSAVGTRLLRYLGVVRLGAVRDWTLGTRTGLGDHGVCHQVSRPAVVLGQVGAQGRLSPWTCQTRGALGAESGCSRVSTAAVRASTERPCVGVESAAPHYSPAPEQRLPCSPLHRETCV